ncbi:MAG: hypothetical protein R2697_10865 [Ilumatobacteraceae bacterium]
MTVWPGGEPRLKAILLDQSVIAGFGNMCVDEVLWQAGVSPPAPPTQLDDELLGRLDERPASTSRRCWNGVGATGAIDPEVRASIPPCRATVL